MAVICNRFLFDLISGSVDFRIIDHTARWIVQDANRLYSGSPDTGKLQIPDRERGTFGKNRKHSSDRRCHNCGKYCYLCHGGIWIFKIQNKGDQHCLRVHYCNNVDSGSCNSKTVVWFHESSRTVWHLSGSDHSLYQCSHSIYCIDLKELCIRERSRSP